MGINRRGFLGALAGLLALPAAAIAVIRRPACDHHIDKLQFTPGENGESGHMHCLCGQRLPICPGNNHPKWIVGTNSCPDCGITLKVFWEKKFGTFKPIRYKQTHHTFVYAGRTCGYTTYEPIKE